MIAEFFASISEEINPKICTVLLTNGLTVYIMVYQALLFKMAL